MADLDKDPQLVDYESVTHLNIDKGVEWIRDVSTAKVASWSYTRRRHWNIEVLLCGSSSDDGKGSERRKFIGPIQNAHENDEAMVSEHFYIYFRFSVQQRSLRIKWSYTW